MSKILRKTNAKSVKNTFDQAIVQADVSALAPYDKNARKHSKKQIQQIAASIEEFGFTNPILIDQNHTILAGHGRVEAAKHLGMENVPCVYIEHLTDKQKRAYVLADNKLALNATWDEDLLSQELKALSELDLSFDIETTGFSIAEIDQLIDNVAPEEGHDPKDDQIPVQIEKRAQLGDIWQLGQHRLICGDSLDLETIVRLMDCGQAQPERGFEAVHTVTNDPMDCLSAQTDEAPSMDKVSAQEYATMIFTDPPYNVKIDGHVGGKGKIKHEEFAMASGEMSQSEFTKFLRKAFENLTRFAKDGSIHFICMDWRHMREVIDAAGGIYSELKNLIVWAKNNGGMGTFYRSRHELIFAYKHGTAEHINSFELGQHGRYRTNVWEYRGANLEELKMHPTVKPVQMIADAMKDCSGRGDVVLDLFGGSGSTLIAAEKTGRRGYLCEFDPHYCDIILTRWEVYVKDEAICVWRDGAPYDAEVCDDNRDI